MTEVHANKCPNCGAPLTVSDPGHPIAITCPYCGASLSVSTPDHASNKSGEEEAANQFFTKPEAEKKNFAEPSAELQSPTPPTKGGRIWTLFGAALTFFTILIPVVIGIIAFLYSNAYKNLPYFGKSSSFPLTCKMNKKLVVDGMSVEMKDVAIIAETNCHLTLKNSRIKATTIIKGEENLDLKIINSTLTATDDMIVVRNNMVLKIDGGKLKSAKKVVSSNSNAKIEMVNNSNVESADVAFDFGDNPEIIMSKSTIKAENTAIKSKSNPVIKMKAGAEMSSKDVTMILDSNPHIEIESSTIEGNEAAIDAGVNADINLLPGAVISGRIVGMRLNVNSKIEITGAIVKGSKAAIDTSGNDEIKLWKKAKLQAESVALHLASRSKVHLRDSYIESDDTAIRGDRGCVVYIENSKVTGQKYAFILDRLSTLTLINSQIEGARKLATDVTVQEQ